MSIHAVRVLAATLITIMASSLLLVLFAPRADAAVGDYTVNITHTQGDAWWSMGRDGAFRALDMKIETGIGSYPVNSNRVWRVITPGLGARIIGGRITGQLVTPDAAFRGRVVVGDDGGAMRTLYESTGSASFSVAIPPGGHDWAQFDLLATSAVKTTATGRNVMTATAVILQLNDYTNPTMVTNQLPGESTWYGSACTPWVLPVNDQGSGLSKVTVERIISGVAPQLVATVPMAIQANSPMPGPAAATARGCLGDTAREHGSNEYQVTVRDVSGRTQTATFRTRVDLREPVIEGGVETGSSSEQRHPDLQFHVSDPDSGIASVSATLDHMPAMLDLIAGRQTVSYTEDLSIGTHEVTITATDNAGNTITQSRSFTVTDVTPPQITVETPSASGTPNATLRATATDTGGSGVDDTHWTFTVNGERIDGQATGGAFTAAFGPMAPGEHQLVITVTDLSGNVATKRLTYRVTAAEVLGTPIIGGRSGVFVVKAPPVTTFGGRARIVVLVVRNGHPVTGLRVVASRNGATVGSAGISGTGLATLSVPAAATSTIVVRSTDATLPATKTTLLVAPRLSIATSTRRPIHGRPFIITGRVVPGVTGRIVTLETRVGNRWFPVRRNVAVGSGGRFRASVTSARRGSLTIRARTRLIGGWRPATSNNRTVIVR